MNDIHISKNFKLLEFESPDTKEVKIDKELINKLEDLRMEIGKPLIINSGYRTLEHNKKVGGSPNSKHIEGIAADIKKVEGFKVEEMKSLAEKVGFDGIGLYNWGIHVDTRGYEARWDWREGKWNYPKN